MRMELSLPSGAQKQMLLFGQNDANRRLLRAEYNLKIVPRGEVLILDGPDDKVEAVRAIFELLLNEIKAEAGEAAINRRLAIALESQQEEASGGIRTERGRIEPKTPGQKAYVQAVRKATERARTEGFLLPEDATTLIKAAEESRVLR